MAELQQRRSARKERGALPVAPTPMREEGREAEAPALARVVIRTFESEIDPFELSLLDSGHFVLFRKVWRDGQRYIQGALIEQQPFLEGLIASAFRDTTLSQMSELIVAYQGHVLSAFSGQPSEQSRSPGSWAARCCTRRASPRRRVIWSSSSASQGCRQDREARWSTGWRSS